MRGAGTRAATGSLTAGRRIPQLEVLYEVPGLPAYPLPGALEAAYGGVLGFPEPRLVANFVTTLDGVAAIPEVPRATRLISGGSAADRFVVGLLRASADAVLVGAGTLHAHPDTVWTGARAHPASATVFAELRSARRQPAEPRLVVLTATGDLDARHPALHRGALILTSDRGAAALSPRLPSSAEVVAVGDSAVDLRRARDTLYHRGYRLVVSEAGPHLFGSLVAADLVDELFLTTAPLLAGRGAGPRPGLVDGTALLPGQPRRSQLLSVRRSADDLLLRYRLVPADPVAAPGPR